MNDWMDDAACKGVWGLFYLDRGESTTTAKHICRHCPVKQPCLDYALDNHERFGIRGGLTTRERWRLHPQQDTGAA